MPDAEPRQSAFPDLDVDAIARTVGETPDEQLAQGMRSELRGQILDEIFGRMERHLDAEQARGVDAVIHWRIAGRPDGEYDRYETIIRDGRCTVSRERREQPRVTFTTGAVDFLKLVTGNASGPALFLSGKLKIKGDLMFAARAASLFEIPRGNA